MVAVQGVLFSQEAFGIPQIVKLLHRAYDLRVGFSQVLYERVLLFLD